MALRIKGDFSIDADEEASPELSSEIKREIPDEYFELRRLETPVCSRRQGHRYP
jgi:hypothetical protein